MQKVKISLAVRHESARSFIKALIVLIMEVNDNDTKKFKSQFQRWTTEASDFLSKFRVRREFMALANKFMIGRHVFSKELGADIGFLIKDIQKDVNADNSISKFEYDFIRHCGASLHRNADSAWNFLLRNIPKLNEPDLTAEWVEADDVADLVTADAVTALKGIKSITKSVTGVAADIFLSFPNEQALREDNEKQSKLYYKYKKILLTIFKNSLVHYLRTSKKRLMPIDDVATYMNAHGIAHNLPRGFSGGQIDEYGDFYTREGRLLDKKISGPVEVNKKYDPETGTGWVVKSIDPEWRVELRCIGKTKENKTAKYGVVRAFIGKEDSYRKRWGQDVLKNSTEKDGAKRQILAAMADILYVCQARIGGKDPRYPTGNLGLSTVLVKNLDIRGNVATFDYSGKKGAPQHHVYKAVDQISKKVLQILKSLVYGKSDKELVFTSGTSAMVQQYVNKYLRSIGVPEGFTSHKFRHVLGTKEFLTAVARCPFKKEDNPSIGEVNKWLKEEMEKIGAKLHHRTGDKVTGTTALKSYVDPGEISAFYENLGLRAPKLDKSDD